MIVGLLEIMTKYWESRLEAILRIQLGISDPPVQSGLIDHNSIRRALRNLQLMQKLRRTYFDCTIGNDGNKQARWRPNSPRRTNLMP